MCKYVVVDDFQVCEHFSLDCDSSRKQESRKEVGIQISALQISNDVNHVTSLSTTVAGDDNQTKNNLEYRTCLKVRNPENSYHSGGTSSTDVKFFTFTDTIDPLGDEISRSVNGSHCRSCDKPDEVTNSQYPDVETSTF